MKTLRSLSLLSLLVLLAPSALGAQSPSEAFESANALAYQGDYSAAASAYEAIVASGVDDPALFQNLGNAYYRSEALGLAIWSYRRGLRCAPDADLEASLGHNLQVSRRALQARYRASNDGSQFIYSEPVGWLYQLSHLASMEVLLWSFLALWWLLASCLIARRFTAKRSWGSVAIPLAVLVLLVGGLLAARIATDDSLTLGVVVTDGVVMREGPDSHARGVDVPEGMEVRVLDATEGWQKVEIPSGRAGWIADASLRGLP